MTHRKNMHPSDKICRNFPGSCNFGNECWYVHVEVMDTDKAEECKKSESLKLKCNMCDEIFKKRICS